ncbi:MAG: GNAT family N-acetyltransferase [Propionivibrio sp.]
MTPTLDPLTIFPADTVWPVVSASKTSIPMQIRAWSEARASLPSSSARLYCPAVLDGREIRAIAITMLSGGWLCELPTMFEPSDLIWDSEASLEILAKTLARQPHPLCLERVPMDSPSIAALRHAYAGRGIVLQTAAMPTPKIDLESFQGDSTTFLNAGRRSDFRRAERRAASFGSVEFEIHAPTTGVELQRLLGEAYAVNAASWKAGAGTALTTDHAQGSFFTHFANSASADGIVRIAFMRIDGQAVAMQIAVEWQRRFWLLKISYDDAYARCSPGHLLMRHTLRHAIQTGLLSYELMGIMDDWTGQWASERRRYVRVRAIPFSAAVFKMLARKSVRSIHSRLRQIVR